VDGQAVGRGGQARPSNARGSTGSTSERRAGPWQRDDRAAVHAGAATGSGRHPAGRTARSVRLGDLHRRRWRGHRRRHPCARAEVLARTIPAASAVARRMGLGVFLMRETSRVACRRGVGTLLRELGAGCADREVPDVELSRLPAQRRLERRRSGRQGLAPRLWATWMLLDDPSKSVERARLVY
jgi:hypothetical protein